MPKICWGGGSPHDPAPWTNIEVKRPSYGKPRFEQILQPGEGKAVPVLKGEVLHMTQVVGGQSIDFNGYNLHDYKEWLDCGFNRQRGVVTGEGTVVRSALPGPNPAEQSAPQRRPQPKGCALQAWVRNQADNRDRPPVLVEHGFP